MDRSLCRIDCRNGLLYQGIIYMDNWTVIISFTYSYEAHLAKAKLESEEFEVILRDELNAQVCEAGANAVGGVKLCVRESDVIRAIHSLKEGGYIQESVENESQFMKSFGQYTSQIPMIGQLSPELVLMILLALIIILIFIPLAIMYMS
ncbi:MAG: hypothetical protein A2066_15200 [Bacteroidetes bacterium GWB2_41_8]|nr:MAG: hypothetical protein A2066_15200 [Bacteroidetes bacterium GWB2_41_8]